MSLVFHNDWMNCVYYEQDGYSSVADCMSDSYAQESMLPEEYGQFQCMQGAGPYSVMVITGFLILIAAIMISKGILEYISPLHQWAKKQDNTFITLSRTFLVPAGVFIIVWYALFLFAVEIVKGLMC